MKNTSSNEALSMSRFPEHHMRFAWLLKIRAQGSLDALTLRPYLLNLLDEELKVYVRTRMHEDLLLLSLSGSHAWTSPAMFDPKSGQVCLRMRAHTKLSDPSRLSHLTAERQSMLALPSQIDFAGYTATIRRILVVRTCALSLSLGESWHDPLPWSLRRQATLHDLRLNSATHGDSTTQSGSQE